MPPENDQLKLMTMMHSRTLMSTMTGLTNLTHPPKSPFTSYFNEQLPDAEELNCKDVEPDDDVPADNDLYCLRASGKILSILHLFPLWSAAMQKETHIDDDRIEHVSANCRSNATVESYFKSVKHGRFKASRVSPRMFVLNQSKFVNGKLKEACLPLRKRTQSKKKDSGITSDVTEKWHNKRRKLNYRSTATAKRAFNRIRVACRKKIKSPQRIRWSQRNLAM